MCIIPDINVIHVVLFSVSYLIEPDNQNIQHNREFLFVPLSKNTPNMPYVNNIGVTVVVVCYIIVNSGKNTRRIDIYPFICVLRL